MANPALSMPEPWPPRKVGDNFSDTPLRELAIRIEKEYLETSQLPAKKGTLVFQAFTSGHGSHVEGRVN